MVAHRGMGKRGKTKQAAGGAAVQVGTVGGSITLIHLHAPDAVQMEQLARALAGMLQMPGKRQLKRSKR